MIFLFNSLASRECERGLGSMPKFATFDEAKETLKAWDIGVAIALHTGGPLPSEEDRAKAAAAQADIADAWVVRERVRILSRSPLRSESEKALLRRILGEEV